MLSTQPVEFKRARVQLGITLPASSPSLHRLKPLNYPINYSGLSLQQRNSGDLFSACSRWSRFCAASKFDLLRVCFPLMHRIWPGFRGELWGSAISSVTPLIQTRRFQPCRSRVRNRGLCCRCEFIHSYLRIWSARPLLTLAVMYSRERWMRVFDWTVISGWNIVKGRIPYTVPRFIKLKGNKSQDIHSNLRI